MKIEKVNDNQIRCTLSKMDLEDRQIKLSELAYGSQKAKELFQDMIEQANEAFGFEADDIPLMIEAIPMAGENVILLISKVEAPDELDTRFSRFTEGEEEEEISGSSDFVIPKESLTEVMAKADASVDPVCMFEFTDMDRLWRMSHVVGDFYQGENRLYKDKTKNKYYLFVHKSQHSAEDFNRLCNLRVEYGAMKKYTPAVEGYYSEHGKLILKDHALQTLQSL